MRRFIIREAVHLDYSDIRKFYETNPDEHVMLRSEEAVRRAIDEGVFFLALDLSKTDGDRIFAASAVYTVTAQLATGGTVVLKESGGSNVNKQYRGFGVHEVFHWARALHKFILDRGGFDVYFGAIIHPNEPSQKNLLRNGFVEWTDPPPMLTDGDARLAITGKIGRTTTWRIDPSTRATLPLQPPCNGDARC